MNWEAIGAVGALVAAAGVIVSLLYVASQLKQNRQYESGTVDQDLFRGCTLHLQAYIQTPLFRQYWQARREFFTERFQEYVDHALEEAAASEVWVPSIPEVALAGSSREKEADSDGEVA